MKTLITSISLGVICLVASTLHAQSGPIGHYRPLIPDTTYLAPPPQQTIAPYVNAPTTQQVPVQVGQPQVVAQTTPAGQCALCGGQQQAASAAAYTPRLVNPYWSNQYLANYASSPIVPVGAYAQQASYQPVLATQPVVGTQPIVATQPVVNQPLNAYYPTTAAQAPGSYFVGQGILGPTVYTPGQGLFGQPKLYGQGQPIRNVLRYITP